MKIDDALRASPDDTPSPFFARRVMRSIREPTPLAFPWLRLAVGTIASAMAVGTVAAIGPAADIAVVIAFVVIGFAAAGVARIVHA